MPAPVPHPTPRRLAFCLLLALFLTSGCAPFAALSPHSPRITQRIPYENIDRRDFVDAGVDVRTRHGNRARVEVAGRDTLVWFEEEFTGRFTRAFLRRGNTIYVLTRESDYHIGSPSQTVVYRLFMKAWRRANTQNAATTAELRKVAGRR